MKSQLLALAVTLLAAITNSASASECNVFTITKFLLDADVVKCSDATGLTPLSPPSTDVLAKVCGNSACQSMLASLKKLGLGDCTVAGVALESAFMTPIDVYCTATTGTAAPTSAPTSSSTVHSVALAGVIATAAVAISIV